MQRRTYRRGGGQMQLYSLPQQKKIKRAAKRAAITTDDKARFPVKPALELSDIQRYPSLTRTI